MPAGLLNELHVFETVRSYDGVICQVDEHLKRLAESCKGLGRELPETEKRIRSWLFEAQRESGFADSILRLSLHWEGGAASRMLVIARPFKSYPDEMYAKGVSLKTAVMRRSDLRAQDPQIKCSQYVSGVLAHLDALENPAHELIFMDLSGYVAEGTVSNIFIVKNKRVLTPPLASGILRGVTRDRVLALAQRAGFKPLEKCFTRHEVYSADECFMTNTSSEIMPVTMLDGLRIGEGVPGPVTKKLLLLFRKGLNE